MRLEPRAAIIAALVVCACCAPQLALGDSHARSGPRDWNEPSAAPPPHPANFDDGFAPELARIDRQRADRKTAGARQERDRSRLAYRGLSRAEALSLARQQFPSVFDGPLWQGPEAPPGGRIARYLSDHSFIVKDGSDRMQLAESLGPVLAKDGTGHEARIDTRLRQSGTGFAPENTLTPTRVAADAAGSSSLDRAGISFHLVGGDSAARASIAQDKAFYPDALHDSDLTVAPVADGLEVLLQLRSHQSPEDAALKFDMPPGAQLRLVQQAPVTGPDPMPKPEQAEAHIFVGGQSVATIHPPVASDADGVEVPASYHVEGDRLIIHVPHTGGDWHYPILVDPLVVDDYLWKERGGTGNGGSAISQGWGYRMSGSTGFSAYDCSQLNCAPNSVLNGPGLYLSATSGPYGSNGPFTEWFWQAPRSSNIVRVDWRLGGLTTSGTACLYAYVTGPSANTSPNRQARCGTMTVQTWNPVSCVDISHPCGDIGYSQANNQAVFGMQLWNNHPATTWSALGGAYVYLWEGGRPIVQKLLEPQSTQTNQIQWFPPSGWVDENYSKTFRAATHDSELGMSRADFYIDGVSAGGSGNFCNGKYSNQCPSDLVLPASEFNAAPFSLSASSLSEGVHHLSVVATDIIGNPSIGQLNQEWDIRIDKTAPIDNITGSLNVADGTWLREGSYDLTVNATDTRSGVQADQISAGSYSDTKTNKKPDGVNTCDVSTCATTMTHPWTFSTAGKPDGSYQVSVATNDPLGHTARPTPWTVKIDSRAPTANGAPTGSLPSLNNQAIDAGSYDIHASATDPSPGSGIQDIKVLVNGNEEDALHATQSCTQTCPPSMPRDFTFDTTGRLQGRYRIQLIAHDKVQHPTTIADVTVVLDTSPPDVTFSGPLWDARGTQLAPGTYNLHVRATDGTNTDPGARSGVSMVEIYVDGQVEDTFTQPCDQGNCEANRDWSFNTSDYSGGPHDVHVVASDQLGHEVETAAFTVDNPCCIETPSSWAVFSPTTYDVAYGDVDADALADVVARNKLTGDVQVGLSSGTAFATPASWGTFSPLNDLQLADVNGDGAFDLVGHNAAGLVSVALSTGSAFDPATPWGALPAGYEMRVADMDQDGSADLVGRDTSTGNFVVGWSNGTGFDPTGSWGTFDPAYKLSLADVDGDGAADVVGVNPSTGDVSVAIANAGDLSPATSWATGAATSDVTFADGDGDGLDDLILRDRDSDGVTFLPSTGTSFATPTSWGSFSSAYDLGAMDIGGDGNADLVGRQSLTGDVRGAITDAPFPTTAALAADYVPNPPDIEVDPPPSDSSQVQASAASSVQGPALAFQDDWRLLDRKNLVGSNPDATPPGTDPFSTDEPDAITRINHIYDRIQQVTGTGGIIRFNAVWGQMENPADASDPSGYRGGGRWFFDKLDRAVRLARAKGFRIELTLTGGDDACRDFNLNSRNCAGAASTKVNPSTSGYADFVKAVVDHYTRAPGTNVPLSSTDPLRVDYFSLWNEPNNSNFLRTNTTGELPTNLYHNLAVAGSDAYYSAINAESPDPASAFRKVKGTTVMIGELASAMESGWDPGDAKCDHVPLTDNHKCKVTPVGFLGRASRGGLRPQAVALHPYQHFEAPWLAGPPKERGIGRLSEFLHGLDDLCDWGVPASSPSAPKQCRGNLRTPSNKRPRVLLTEFGYFNRPYGKAKANAANGEKLPPRGPRHQRAYHTEKQRAFWLRGGTANKKHVDGALQQAFRPSQNTGFKHIDAMLLYTATELHPNEKVMNSPNNDWDTGLFGRPNPPNWNPPSNPDGDINGTRDYGVREKHKRFDWPQRRLAYCAVHKWAAQRGYVSIKNNKCPR